MSVSLYFHHSLSLCSLKVDVCAAVSGVGIPRSVGKQPCTVWCTEIGPFGSKSADVSVWIAVLILVVTPPSICTSTSFPPCTELKAELQLDWLKGIRGGVRRVQFLDTQQPQRTGLLTLGHNRPRTCLRYTIYLKVSQQHTNRNPALAPYTRTCCPIWMFCFSVRRMMSSGTNWPPSHWPWTTAWLHPLMAKTSHLSSTITAAPSSKSM